MFGKYAIIGWESEASILTAPGQVYGWYESLATALNTASDLVRQRRFVHAVAVKCL